MGAEETAARMSAALAMVGKRIHPFHDAYSEQLAMAAMHPGPPVRE